MFLDVRFLSDSRRRLREGPWGSERKLWGEMKMSTVYEHGDAHGKEAEGGYRILIERRKGMDGRRHDADEVDWVDEYEYSYIF